MTKPLAPLGCGGLKPNLMTPKSRWWPHQVREEGHGLFPLGLEKLGDVHNVPLRQAQLPLQHLPVPVDAALGARVGGRGRVGEPQPTCVRGPKGSCLVKDM